LKICRGVHRRCTDFYITPYLNEAQITSGTRSLYVCAGKVVVSTPYWHAAELLADDRGVLVPFGARPHSPRGDWLAARRLPPACHYSQECLQAGPWDDSRQCRATLYALVRVVATRGRRDLENFATKMLDQKPRELPELEVESSLANDRLIRSSNMPFLASRIFRKATVRMTTLAHSSSRFCSVNWEKSQSACGPWPQPTLHFSITRSISKRDASTTT
jgi:hypothetical protein